MFLFEVKCRYVYIEIVETFKTFHFKVECRERDRRKKMAKKIVIGTIDGKWNAITIASTLKYAQTVLCKGFQKEKKYI